MNRYRNAMPNYTKLFNSIVTSTIWTEDDKTRILWITMLAICDQHGEVHASIPGLARIAGISADSVEIALDKFLSPDPYSRTPDNDGIRIAKIDGGWELLNHAKYRKMASKEDSKAATAARVKRHRERNANVTPCNGDVTPCNAHVTDTRDIAEAEADTKADIVLPKGKNNKRKTLFDPLSVELPYSSDDFRHYWESWTLHRSEIKKPITERSAKEQLSFLKDLGEMQAIASIRLSIGNGWTGLFEPKQSVKQQQRGNFGVKNPTTHNERHPDQLNEDLLSELAKVTTTYH